MVEVPETAGCLEMSQGRQQLQSWTATFPFVRASLSSWLQLPAAFCWQIKVEGSNMSRKPVPCIW